MKISMYRTDLPDWVKNNMQMTCSYCNSFLCDNSDTGVTTARWCSNPKCPGHMAHKMKFVSDFFHVKNFGPQTALSYIRQHKCDNHLEILKEWFKEEKPLVSLSDIAVLACIEGYGETQARNNLNAFSSFTTYFANVTSPNDILVKNKEYLLKCESYFNVKAPLSVNKMLVMGTGSFHGFNNRDEYFAQLNDAFGQFIQIIQTGKRKTGVSYLIKEKDAVDHSKSQIAREQGIPVLTPAEFFDLLQSTFTYMNEE